MGIITHRRHGTDYQVQPFPWMRQIMLDAGWLGRRHHVIRALVELESPLRGNGSVRIRSAPAPACHSRLRELIEGGYGLGEALEGICGRESQAPSCPVTDYGQPLP